jgi:hypothetical protein
MKHPCNVFIFHLLVSIKPLIQFNWVYIFWLWHMATSPSGLAIHWTSSITRPPPFMGKISYNKFQKNYAFHVPRSKIKSLSHQFHYLQLGYWPFHVLDLYNISKRGWHLHYQSSQHNGLLNKQRLFNTKYLKL